MTDSMTKEHTLIAVRVAFPMHLTASYGLYASCETVGSSCIYDLHIFQQLLLRGFCIARFCGCDDGSPFQKPYAWMTNMPWVKPGAVASSCSCPYKGGTA